MSPQIKYAYKSHNTWVYRRTYPKHLQALLGSALKQSLKTGNAKEAKGRVVELNQTYTNIVSEAEGQVDVHSSTDTDETVAVLTLAVAVPRYQRARLLGQRSVTELATEYLVDALNKLRPSSYIFGLSRSGISPWISASRSWVTLPTCRPTSESTKLRRRHHSVSLRYYHKNSRAHTSHHKPKLGS